MGHAQGAVPVPHGETHALVGGVGQSLQVRLGDPGKGRLADPYVRELVHGRSKKVLAVGRVEGEDSLRLAGCR